MERETQMREWNHGLIWFGAAISIAEILTGMSFASLGFATALGAIVLGHLIGGVLMYGCGILGARTGLSAMETVKGAFGTEGGKLFALLNCVQLLGWTAVMIATGASAAVSLYPLSEATWCVILGAFILIWVAGGLRGMVRLNTVMMGALCLLSILLSEKVFSGMIETEKVLETTDGLTFGRAIELSVAMPLSWLPLIADYTRRATARPRRVTAVGVCVYGLASSWMYLIGLGAVIWTGESDITRMLAASGLGLWGLVIVVGSTVTTTYLDVYSAGVAAVSLWHRLRERWVALAIGVLGVVVAIGVRMSAYENFLYFISSVFAPMAMVVIVESICKRKEARKNVKYRWDLLAVWLIGFVVYHVLLNQAIETPLGLTLPVMALTGILTWICSNQQRRK